MSFARLEATQLDLLEYSFDQIKPYRLGFTSDFYTALFTDYPQVKPLFANSNILAQYQKLMDALILVIQNLCTPNRIAGSLRRLGSKHVNYGILPEHYPMLGNSLLKTLAGYLESNWTPEIEKAWADAYRAIVEVMLEGSEYSPQILQVSSAGSKRTYPVREVEPVAYPNGVASHKRDEVHELGDHPTPPTPTTTASESLWQQLPYKPYNRPLAEILADFSKPIPDGFVKNPQQEGSEETFIAGNVLATLLDHFAPGWEGSVISSQVMGDCSVVSYRITIHSAEGTFSRESLGSAVLRTTGNGDLFADAETRAFINAAAKWGLAFNGSQ